MVSWVDVLVDAVSGQLHLHMATQFTICGYTPAAIGQSSALRATVLVHAQLSLFDATSAAL